MDGIPTSNFAVQERQFTLQDLKRWSDKGRLKEAFGCGTAVCESLSLSPSQKFQPSLTLIYTFNVLAVISPIGR